MSDSEARRAWRELIAAIEAGVDRETLLAALSSARVALGPLLEPPPVHVRRYCFDDLHGASPLLARALDLARRAACVSAPVLITGESGTGKEVLAQAIHAASAHRDEPFVALNCAAIPRELLESELFGYERGAFTGARADGAIGKLQQAGAGTILLDEIGDMPLDMQAKMLRVLQERVFTPLGSNDERPLRARILATTHRDLEDAVAHGAFRLDLLHRLRVIAIVMPALRDRPEDIAPLALQHLRHVATTQGKAAREIGPRVIDALVKHRWPGNVRELANVIEREVSLLAPDRPVLEELCVPFSAREHVPAAIVPMAEVERRAHLHALQACGGNMTQAAKALGVSRAQFYVKLQKWRGELEEPRHR